MPRKSPTAKAKTRVTGEKVAPDFFIGRDTEPVKKPSQKEIDAMRQKQMIRKNPLGTI